VQVASETAGVIVRNYVASLDLKRNPLGNKGVIILSDGIAKSKSLIHLDLRSTAFAREGAHYLFKALNKNQTVTCLSIGNIKGLHNNFMSGKAMQGIQDYLKKSLQLTFLDLKGASIGNDGLTYLLAGLKYSRSVKDVNLCFNNLGSNGSSTVVDLILKTYIKRLNLSENPLGRQFVSEFFKKSQDQEFYMTHLSLSSCELGSPGLGELFAALRRGLYLSHLKLDAIRYDDFELRHLGWFIANCLTLKSFSTANCMFADEGIRAIAESFVDFSTMESINLSHNKITSSGLQSTLDKLAEKCGRHLKSLDLSENFIDVFLLFSV
jgi:Ran GTPase-activating protein (RanGAP) involved in mRNA processing and transport